MNYFPGSTSLGSILARTMPRHQHPIKAFRKKTVCSSTIRRPKTISLNNRSYFPIKNKIKHHKINLYNPY